jgi:hypothetical protein
LVSHWKSARKSWISGVNRRHCLSAGCLKAACKVLNSPRLPGIPRTMLWSSPSTCCNTFVAIWVRSGLMPLSSLLRRATQCGGTLMVRLAVSMGHPRMTFRVSQMQTPLRNVLTDAGSWQWLVLVSAKAVGRSLRCGGVVFALVAVSGNCPVPIG